MRGPAPVSGGIGGVGTCSDAGAVRLHGGAALDPAHSVSGGGSLYISMVMGGAGGPVANGGVAVSAAAWHGVMAAEFAFFPRGVSGAASWSDPPEQGGVAHLLGSAI